jgi:hypothetical protein
MLEWRVLCRGFGMWAGSFLRDRKWQDRPVPGAASEFFITIDGRHGTQIRASIIATKSSGINRSPSGPFRGENFRGQHPSRRRT